MAYDAFLLLSFGGPEHPDDVLPFLQNVTRGRGVPPERLAEVVEHYQHFGGVSPINQQCRDLLAALRADFAAHGIELPIYWGNRNWHPMLADTLATMRDDGVRHALAFVTSAYGGFSACRQYRIDIEAARSALGQGAPVVDKLRHFADHPGFIQPHADAVRAALGSLDPSRLATTRLVFTAHSVPVSMAASSGPDGGLYEAQLRETAALVAAEAGLGSAFGATSAAGARRLDTAGPNRAPGMPFDLVWQSRSGAPHIAWLEPDINQHLATLADAGASAVVVSPIGFVSDHLEVVWDLDTEARATAQKLGLDFVRAATPGTDPRFVAMVRELVLERTSPENAPRRRLGRLPCWDVCAPNCCPAPAKSPTRNANAEAP